MQGPSTFEDPEKAAQELIKLLVEVGRRQTLRDPLAHMCEELGLTSPQIHGLFWMGADGALTMGELARRLGISEKTVTGVVDRLERDGLVKRERDEKDRRVVRASLTKKGQGAAKKIEEASLAHTTMVMSLLDGPDRAELYRLVQKLTQRAEELGKTLNPES